MGQSEPKSGAPGARGAGVKLRLLLGKAAIALPSSRDSRQTLDQAVRDPLTGVYNRQFYYEMLGKEIHRCKRYGSELSVVLLDVDNLKSVNDALGHGAGDDALQRIARLAGELLRPSDSLARLGGEEFGVLLPETSQLDALLVAERLRSAIARSAILPRRRVTVSGGISSCPQDAGELDGLMSRAGAALDWAKHNGKNLCAVAGEVVVEETTDGSEHCVAHLHALVSAIDGQSHLTQDHSENVASYAVTVALALGLGSERVVRLRRAALLHDIGKAAVRREILENPARLSDAEYAEIKLHPVAGATMLANSGLAEEAVWVRHHHERIDGQGYPDGLAGEAIPLEARILHIVDAFEAMTSDRPYQRSRSAENALAELRRCAGTQFDERLVGVLAELVRDGALTNLATAR